MVWVRVQGAEQLVELAKRLRKAPKELRSLLYRGINRAAKPLRGEIKASALDKLPARGGLARRVSRGKVATKRRISGNSAGVRIVNRADMDIGSINRGRVRHKTFGHKPWVNQSVPPGFWTEPMVDSGPRVAGEIQGVMDEVTRMVEG